MDEHTRDPLHILADLAREYQDKYTQLAQTIQESEPERITAQLRARAELTTGRFRSAQHALLSALAQPGTADGQDAHGAALTLCRCFDEMRILFQFLLEQCIKTSG